MSLIMNYGEYLDCVHYVSDVFDASKGFWWHCDNVNMTGICDFPKGVYNR